MWKVLDINKILLIITNISLFSRTKHRSHHHRSKHKHRHHASVQVDTGASNDQTTNQESQERRNYYLDLAGIENFNVTRLQTDTPLGESIALEGSPNKRRHHHHHKRERHKNRDRSLRDSVHVETERTEVAPQGADLVIPPYQFLENMVERVTENAVNPVNEEITSPTSALQTPPPPPRMRPVSLPPHLPDVVSPHHHRRHRNRERNRRLAMQQVAEWIEREHPNWGGQLQVLEEINVDCPTTAEGLTQCVAQTDSQQPQQIVIERHEHHHIHEHHHHHHYHYYQET